jgi:hypothetical protein
MGTHQHQQQQQPNRYLQPSPVGRAVRLHFRCHAELPIGSFLRVTGSTLWAPGTSASDPTDATGAVNRAETAAFPVALDHTTQGGGAGGAALQASAATSMYASSVEMVTTPEEYPVWRTRHPVVVVLHHDKKTVQHHYYRYLVVSPGGSASIGTMMQDSLIEGAIDEVEQPVSTSNEAVGSTPVVQWEDPFNAMLSMALGSEEQMRSSVSLPSVSAQPTRSDYRSLPYRVVDINVLAGQQSELAASDGSGTVLPRMDRWNAADDASFRSYRIREAVRTSRIQKRIFVIMPTSQFS